MNPMIYTILITSLSTSTIIIMTSHHWLLAWLALELNTMSIIPLIIKPHHPRATEAATKYFLIQAMAAALILFASTMNAWQTGQWSITHTMSPTASIIMTTAIMMKLGVVPAHFWYPEVLQGSTMRTALIMSTWQKIAPLTLLYLTLNNLPTNIMITMGLASALIGGWMGLNQTQTRKILAFSSIAHMGWLLIALTMNPALTTLTMTTYLMMTTSTFLLLDMTETKTLLDMGTVWSLSPTMLTSMMMTLMSLGGLPPLTGFMPKWAILKDLTLMNLTPLSLTLALASLPSLFFYIRMAYLTMLTTPPHTTNTQHKWRSKPNLHTLTTPTIILTTLLLPTTHLLYNTT
uniref:NADH-ubiquinone oxidoreductase chain 2 n=1 Tax=Geckolepis petiti TaxID=476478 RepID=A0A7R7G1T4_9SAUR|nr:NADH dehydrogenase subunit 2 [Geckolepis petiti]